MRPLWDGSISPIPSLASDASEQMRALRFFREPSEMADLLLLRISSPFSRDALTLWSVPKITNEINKSAQIHVIGCVCLRILDLEV
jgi:hypothetical protein